MLELYQEVTLTRDVPEEQLKAGDIAVLVDFVPHPNGGDQGCILEVFNAVGETIAVVTVPISAVQALQSDQVLSARSRSRY
ncbi:MAG: DUF4926 domain-containing protein [Oscillatoriales cyanobacterium C42_A2020_001]|nr:DUF4926 domain-containing protein [Leptolyngbyaceae cyanobacterium C42_A2020_001]